MSLKAVYIGNALDYFGEFLSFLHEGDLDCAGGRMGAR